MYCRNCGSEMNNEAVVCVKCGVPAGKGNGYCPTCGAETAAEAVVCPVCQTPLAQKPRFNIEKRNLVLAIVLSIVTCGIYSIYWFIKLTDEMNIVSGNEKDTSGVVAFLLTLVTCGIYGYFWAYKMGDKRDSLDPNSQYSGIVYLLLSIFGFGIIAYALMQDAINKAVDEN